MATSCGRSTWGEHCASQAGLNLRQPIRRVWVALPPGARCARRGRCWPDLLARTMLNAKQCALIGDESELVERRVKPLLPKIGKRLGAQTQAVLAAARNNEVEYLPNGGVPPGAASSWPRTRSRSWPRRAPGTAVAHDQGLVVVIDTDA